jgi:hypothetical protein
MAHQHVKGKMLNAAQDLYVKLTSTKKHLILTYCTHGSEAITLVPLKSAFSTDIHHISYNGSSVIMNTSTRHVQLKFFSGH